MFVGDSGNDQVMFQHFTHSVGVANIRDCAARLTHLPTLLRPVRAALGLPMWRVPFWQPAPDGLEALQR